MNKKDNFPLVISSIVILKLFISGSFVIFSSKLTLSSSTTFWEKDSIVVNPFSIIFVALASFLHFHAKQQVCQLQLVISSKKEKTKNYTYRNVEIFSPFSQSH
jgi:hypothetical protein